MKKFLALVATVAMMAPVSSFAADAVSEDDATDINLFLRAELEESVKVIISNDSMEVDPLLPNEGTIHLDGGDVEKIDVGASRGATACHNENGLIVYTGGVTCVLDPAGAGKASFEVEYGYEIELSGAGVVSLDLALNTIAPAADTNFQASEIESSGSADPAGASILVDGLGHTDTGTITWRGDMEFDAGSSFEDNIVVDISLL